MTYINIPSLHYNNIKFNIKLNDDKTNDIIICESLYSYLNNIKQNINIYNIYWDAFKKITNPYEYIHTIVPNYKCSIIKYKPISRSFFKMIEIINTFNFLTEKENIVSFHLAEGPGGFIEAFNYIRNNKKDIYHGMTLISNNNNVPSWKKSLTLINSNKNIIIENGSTGTGDLFQLNNLKYCYEKFYNSINYITADGGFDFSIDFNNQEQLSIKLIIAQIFFALVMQKKGGNLILKIFDIFKLKTVELIFLLSNLYEHIYIFKPNTSRIANSEKYIICKNYNNNNIISIENLINNFESILENIDNIYSLFNLKIPKLFINKLQEINAIYGQQQIENINMTLNYIREYVNINKYININSWDSNILYKQLKYNSELNCFITDSQLDNNQNLSDSQYNFFDITDLKEICKDNSNNNIKLDTDLSNNIISNKFYQKLNSLKFINMQKSNNWCKKHEFEINKDFVNLF